LAPARHLKKDRFRSLRFGLVMGQYPEDSGNGQNPFRYAGINRSSFIFGSLTPVDITGPGFAPPALAGFAIIGH